MPGALALGRTGCSSDERCGRDPEPVTSLIDSALNRVTMYRLVLYYLIFLVVAGVALSFFGFLPLQPLDLLVSVSVLIFVCWIANSIFAKLFGVPANTESLYITAFILALIITPRSASGYRSAASAPLVFAGVCAMASKYILAFRRKHIFNPAAAAVALTAFTLNYPASWWVGTPAMMPFVLFGGLLVARKIARFDLILSFFVAACAVILGPGLAKGTSVVPAASQFLADTPLLFFAFVMLTEPLTTPPARARRIVYGAMVGFLFAPSLHRRPGVFDSGARASRRKRNLLSHESEGETRTEARGQRRNSPTAYLSFGLRPTEECGFGPGNTWNGHCGIRGRIAVGTGGTSRSLPQQPSARCGSV